MKTITASAAKNLAGSWPKLPQILGPRMMKRPSACHRWHAVRLNAWEGAMRFITIWNAVPRNYVRTTSFRVIPIASIIRAITAI